MNIKSLKSRPVVRLTELSSRMFLDLSVKNSIDPHREVRLARANPYDRELSKHTVIERVVNSIRDNIDEAGTVHLISVGQQSGHVSAHEEYSIEFSSDEKIYQMGYLSIHVINSNKSIVKCVSTDLMEIFSVEIDYYGFRQ